MNKLVFFDIDGTLADLTHRLHHVKNGNRRWDAFFDEAHLDKPILEMIDLVRTLRYTGHIILLVSGRSDRIKTITEDWMKKHKVEYQRLYMRKDGDCRKDDVIKREILNQIRGEFPFMEIAFVVDDRPSVVKMWREEGLICLQCAEWDEKPLVNPSNKGLLTLMIGPSGAGKSTWLGNQWFIVDEGMNTHNIQHSHIISSDQIRADLCGNFRDQTKNAEVFTALHAVVKTRIAHGLPTVVDATNIKRADRIALANLSDGGPIRYIIIDRPLEEKYRDGGWRNDVGFDLIKKHHDSFQSSVKEALKGDGLPNVTVLDLRKL